MKITMSIKLCIVAFLASILLSNCNANPSPNIKDYSQRFRFTDSLRDILESPRLRRSEGNDGHFFRAVRRTLPFQLVPQPPLAYARSSNFVGEPQVVNVNTDLESEEFLPIWRGRCSDLVKTKWTLSTPCYLQHCLVSLYK